MRSASGRRWRWPMAGRRSSGTRCSIRSCRRSISSCAAPVRMPVRWPPPGCGWDGASAWSTRADHCFGPNASRARRSTTSSRPWRPRSVGAGEWTAVVLMSHDYLRDAAFLSGFVGRGVRYLGVLGPRDRTDRLLAELREVTDRCGPGRASRTGRPRRRCRRRRGGRHRHRCRDPRDAARSDGHPAPRSARPDSRVGSAGVFLGVVAAILVGRAGDRLQRLLDGRPVGIGGAS